MDAKDPSSGLITDVGQATWAFLWEHHRIKLVIFSLLVIIVTALSVVYLIGPTAIILPGVIFSVWYSLTNNQLQKQFLVQFAKLNKFSLVYGEPPRHIDGRAFAVGDNHVFSDLICGSFNDLPFEFFTYQYTYGNERTETTSTFSVIAFDLPRPVPQVFAKCLRYGHRPLLSTQLVAPWPGPDGESELTFGNDFDNYFRVKITPGSEIETLQIIEPDLMADLIDQPHRFDFELTGKTLFLYNSGKITKKTQLDSLFAFAHAITRKLNAEISHLDYIPYPSNKPMAISMKNRMGYYSQMGLEILTLLLIIAGVGAFIISSAISTEFRTITGILGVSSTLLGLLLLGIQTANK